MTVCDVCGEPIEQSGPGARRRRHHQCGGTLPRGMKRERAAARTVAGPGRGSGVAQALGKALRAAPPGPGAEVAVALARRLAAEIDAAATVSDLERACRQFLAVLEALGLASRVPVPVPAPAGGGGSVARLRERARARRERASI